MEATNEQNGSTVKDPEVAAVDQNAMDDASQPQNGSAVKEAEASAVGENTESAPQPEVPAEASEETVTVPAEKVASPVKKVSGPPSDLEKRIIRQIEYYFGDANLSKDKFLLEQIKKDDGWVSLSVLGTFNRLKQLSDDSSVVATAMRKSTSGLVQVSDDDKSLRRSTDRPLPEQNDERRRDLAARTVYAKRFPLEASLDALMDFFSQFGEVEQVVMRKNTKKTFKGSVFVLFATKEAAAAFLAKESVQFEGKDLESRLTRAEYFTQHAEMMRTIKDKEQTENEELLKKEKEEKLQESLVRGAILRVTGVSATTKMDQVKEFFSSYKPVAWVDMDPAKSQATLRFEAEGGAEAAWKEAMEKEGKVVLDGAELEGVPLEGEEEEAHWREVMEQKAKRAAGSAGRRGGGRGGRGGRRGGRGGRHGLRSDSRGEKRSAPSGGPDAKKAKA